MGNRVDSEGRSPHVKWDDLFYVKAYKLALVGMSDPQIAQTLGSTAPTFRGWVEKRPALAEALRDAREVKAKRSGVQGFLRHADASMPEHLKRVWADLTSDDHDTRERGRGTSIKVRKHLFVYAMVASGFNAAIASAMIGIHPGTYAGWRKDPDFKRIMERVKECRKDFFENALMDLVNARDPAAVLFVNKTVNRDRGYDAKVTIKVEGEVNHNHVISVKDLSVDAKRMLLDEARRKREALEDRSAIKDAEFTVKGTG